MLLSGMSHRVLRFAALGTWALLGFPVILGFFRQKYPGFSTHHFSIWLTAFLVFGPALWLSSELRGTRPQKKQVVALALQSIAALTMIDLVHGYYLGFLLVLVSWQLALFFSVFVATVLGVLQTAALIYIYAPRCDFGWGWAASGTYIGFQVFAMVTAFVARSEASLRQDLGRTNAELLATRELLSESARGAERIKISGELHDLLGHSLTALSLHLEVASHKANADAAKDIEKAQRISRAMLGDVRGVVSALRRFENMDVCRALEALTRDVPYIDVHLTCPQDLHIEDAWRAQVLLRCMQEIITNAMKHSGAKNLWIDIASVKDGLDISAHDDGRGNELILPGIGLSDMQSRFEEFGGRLTYGSAASHGFRIQAWLPLQLVGVA
jgi:signal transduction histidine kinase